VPSQPSALRHHHDSLGLPDSPAAFRCFLPRCLCAEKQSATISVATDDLGVDSDDCNDSKSLDGKGVMIGYDLPLKNSLWLLLIPSLSPPRRFALLQQQP
jgi:hypothetical protein